MPPIVVSTLAFTGLAALLYAVTRLGARVGARRRALRDEIEDGSAIVGSIFALLGLLLAFTFNGAAGRLETRRTLIVDEANAIGTTWQRLDVVPPAAQPALRAALRDYATARGALYTHLGDAAAVARDTIAATEAQARLWRLAVAATASPDLAAARTLLLPALSDMSDVATRRNVAIATHVPWPIVAVLGVLAVACAWLAGVRLGERETGGRTLALAFAVTTAITAWVTADLEFPRFGLVRLDDVNALIVSQARAMR